MRMQQLRKPLRCRVQTRTCLNLPRRIGQCLLHGPPCRAAERPWPQAFAHGSQHCAICADKSRTCACHAEELAHRAQHDQTGPLGEGAYAMLRGRIHEGLVDHQPPTACCKPRMQLQQRVGIEAVGAWVIGVDQHDHIQRLTGLQQLRSAHRHDRMSGTLPCLRMLGVARREHADAAGCAQQRQGLDRRLRAGHRQYLRRAVI